MVRLLSKSSSGYKGPGTGQATPTPAKDTQMGGGHPPGCFGQMFPGTLSSCLGTETSFHFDKSVCAYVYVMYVRVRMYVVGVRVCVCVCVCLCRPFECTSSSLDTSFRMQATLTT